MPEVDHFLGSSDMLKLGDVLHGERRRAHAGGQPRRLDHARDGPAHALQGRHSAYVKIAEGCNRTCSFCAIPGIRGKQRSRPSTTSSWRPSASWPTGREVELNLVSQDTIAYGRDLDEGPRSRGARARRVADVPGVRGCASLPLPRDAHRRARRAVAKHPKVLPYVDMPLQHAADACSSACGAATAATRLRAS
jgi:ribosomal protein S12 methylthiotransferase